MTPEQMKQIEMAQISTQLGAKHRLSFLDKIIGRAIADNGGRGYCAHLDITDGSGVHHTVRITAHRINNDIEESQ